jgi:hypothetical protein
MVTAAELDYLERVGREAKGDVVEFGPWLGGSTCRLAQGMRHNPDAGRLHVIDNFRWREFMASRAPGLDLRPGESFRYEFERNLADFADLLVVHEARLPDDRSGDLEFDQPIRGGDEHLPVFAGIDSSPGVVFIDGAKSWRALVHALRTLRPGPGCLLVCQDYKNWAAYWVPMCLSAITQQQPGALEIVEVLPSNTVTFKVHEPLKLDWLPDTIDGVGQRVGMQWLIHAQDLPGLDADGRLQLALARAPWLATNGDWESAAAAIRGVERAWPLRNPARPLERARQWLERHTRRRIRPRVTRRAYRKATRVYRRVFA